MSTTDTTHAWESKAGLAAFLDRLVDTHMRYAVPHFAGLELGRTEACFDTRSARLEGLARLFWGVTFALSGGVAPRRLDDMIAGIAAGTNPNDPAYWGPVGDCDQRAVEMAAIAAALLENPTLATRLGTEGAANLYAWLSGIHHVDMPVNNWRFFRIFVLKALAAAGEPIDAALLAAELDFIDSQHRGGGWYNDHQRECRDYYTPFAFHCYSLMYVRWFMHDEPERCRRYIDRAREFALRYRYWFDDDGSQIAYGRSLTYRFATVCFWPLLATVGHPDLSPGVLRGLWSRAIQWWLCDPGRVFDSEGRVTIGYGYPNQLMSEFYNSPQSPLWMLKSLFPLALNESDPFWQAAPEACPYPESVLFDHEGGFLVERRQGGAYLLAGAPVSAELRNCVDKYMKFAYSSRHGFGVEGASWLANGCVGDNILILRAYDHWFGREKLLESHITDKTLVTRWSPLPDCLVETRQEFVDDGEIRFHILDLPSSLEFVATGHAADMFARSEATVCGVPGQHAATAKGRTLFSTIEDSDGRYAAGVAPLAPNTNVMFPQAATPYLAGRLPQGRTVLRTVLRYGKNP